MTDKDIFTGEITIRPHALRQDLETTPIKCGDHGGRIYNLLNRAQAAFHEAALALPDCSDVSNATCAAICEASEIITNLGTRIDYDEPNQTAIEREAKNKS